MIRLCLRLERLLGNKELSDWAKAEAGRNESADGLPDYRIFKTQVRGTFLGPVGSSLTNVPIPQFLIKAPGYAIQSLSDAIRWTGFHSCRRGARVKVDRPLTRVCLGHGLSQVVA